MRLLAAFLVVPNLAVMLAVPQRPSSQPLVNVDYLFLGVAAPLLHPLATTAVFAALLVLDAAAALAAAFHLDLDDFVTRAGDLTAIANAATVSLAAIVVLAAMAVTLLARTVAGPATRSTPRLRFTLLVTFVLVATADVLNGTNRSSRLDYACIPANIANSSVFGLLRAVHAEFRARHRPPAAERFRAVPSATAPLLAELRAGTVASTAGGPDVLLVVVESLGVPTDTSIKARLLEPLTDPAIRGRYTVRTGEIASHGATASGEFRELCGVLLRSLREIGRPPDPCLPTRLRHVGFYTVAIHGYGGRFYDRSRWYPLVAFERAVFAEDSAWAGFTRRCGFTFRGICDGDAASVVRAELLRPPRTTRRFVYWLTLNSHLPLDPRGLTGSSPLCGAGVNAAVCGYYQLIDRALNTIARIALDPDLPPVRIIAVGDHPPPFLSRSASFVTDRVPFVELIPSREASP